MTENTIKKVNVVSQILSLKVLRVQQLHEQQ